jgi:uncharacterized protein (DUF433 family)
MNFPDLDRIASDPRAMGGKTCIRGIRITVGTITGLLACGESIDSVLNPTYDVAEFRRSPPSALSDL